jgi:malonyl CoA-acyl carrier protein transacylase
MSRLLNPHKIYYQVIGGVMSVYMFPGQGAQIKGMGAELFKQFPEQVNQANELLGFSIEELCLSDQAQQLGKTQYTQPALYTVEVLSIMAINRNKEEHNFFIGHSLGEYAALFAAGAFDFITGLKLVQKRGALMAQAHGGGMLAVINLDHNKIKELMDTFTLNSIDFANFNSKKQVVLSGQAEDINKLSEIIAKQQGALCIPLSVSGAFHSRYMQSAAKEFEQFIEPLKLNLLHDTVIANATAQPYTETILKDNLVKQITHPVRWVETIAYLKNKGESHFIEIGPGTVLARLMDQN